MQVRVGCDVQLVAEVEQAVADFGARYLDRVYTRNEQQVLDQRGIASLAGRFAAKEAIVKLLGLTGPLDHRSIEIVPGADERPRVVLTDGPRSLADEQGITEIDLSISHAGGLAFAVAVALGTSTSQNGPPDDVSATTKTTTKTTTKDMP